MSCRYSENDLALYVEGDLSPAKAEEVNVHLTSCKACRQLVDELRESQSLFKSIRQETVSPAELLHLRARVMEKVAVRAPRPFWGRWVYALAGAAFVAAIVAVVLGRYGHREQKFVKVAETSPVMSAAPAVIHVTEVENKAPVKLSTRHRRRQEVVQPKVSGETLKPMMVKLQTADPNIVIYWLFDQKGDSL